MHKTAQLPPSTPSRSSSFQVPPPPRRRSSSARGGNPGGRHRRRQARQPACTLLPSWQAFGCDPPASANAPRGPLLTPGALCVAVLPSAAAGQRRAAKGAAQGGDASLRRFCGAGNRHHAHPRSAVAPRPTGLHHLHPKVRGGRTAAQVFRLLVCSSASQPARPASLHEAPSLGELFCLPACLPAFALLIYSTAWRSAPQQPCGRPSSLNTPRALAFEATPFREFI